MRKGSQLPQDLVVSKVRKANLVSGISVFLSWLAYLAVMHMKSQFRQAWLAHSSDEINYGMVVILALVKLRNCESEPYINHAILLMLVYCNFVVVALPA